MYKSCLRHATSLMVNVNTMSKMSLNRHLPTDRNHIKIKGMRINIDQIEKSRVAGSQRASRIRVPCRLHGARLVTTRALARVVTKLAVWFNLRRCQSKRLDSGAAPSSTMQRNWGMHASRHLKTNKGSNI